MSHFTVRVISGVLLASSVVIVGCGKDTETAAQQPAATASEPVLGNAETTATSESPLSESSDMNVSVDQIGTGDNLAAMPGADDIPYPVYPNSSKYRIGGENGLMIVLFQTEDSFEEVDSFYQSQANLPRLSAMNDYVRYSADSKDQDPWATTKPGIVIHQFNDADERQAVGADDSAKTNIIMSFQ